MSLESMQLLQASLQYEMLLIDKLSSTRRRSKMRTFFNKAMEYDGWTVQNVGKKKTVNENFKLKADIFILSEDFNFF